MNYMKTCSLLSLTAAAALLSSCASMEDFDTVSVEQVGVAYRVLPATIISAEDATQEATSTSKNIGTAVGAVLGVAGEAVANGTLRQQKGMLLPVGKGSGRVASSLGIGLASALAGRYLVASMAQTAGQRLTVRVDDSGETFSFVQPVFKKFGPLSPGMHGNFYLGDRSVYFRPDGAVGMAN